MFIRPLGTDGGISGCCTVHIHEYSKDKIFDQKFEKLKVLKFRFFFGITKKIYSLFPLFLMQISVKRYHDSTMPLEVIYFLFIQFCYVSIRYVSIQL